MAIKFSPTTFITISLIFFLLANTETNIGVEGKLCEKLSLTWSGRCGDSGHCEQQCQNAESAKRGACRDRRCFCYFDC
uniref:DEFL1 n=1 Tax=Panax notoginseng TaxID=44586 RepID=A0A513WY76_9APIA|nr:DEFL1 [Panax notoginseng]